MYVIAMAMQVSTFAVNYKVSSRGCENVDTVEPVLKDHPIGHKNIVAQDRWSLVTYTLECRTFCPKLVVLQDRWSLMAVISPDRFHCTVVPLLKYTL